MAVVELRSVDGGGHHELIGRLGDRHRPGAARTAHREEDEHTGRQHHAHPHRQLPAVDEREALNDPEWARVIPALLLLKTHQEGIADLEERLGDRQDHMLERIIAIGVADGCLPADADIEQIAAQLVGPLVFAHLTGRPPVTEEFAQRIVDDFLRSHTVVET